MNKVVVITGPTATGKTRLAVELALKFGGEVVGADSMQIYRHMDIGTAKPTAEEMRGVVHHMIDVADPNEGYSVSRYVAEASKAVDDILARGKLPIIAGGTNLYIDSLLSGREFAPEPSGTGVREALSGEYDKFGGEEMHARLAEKDPAAAARIHPNDKKRIVRALEVLELSGATISAHDEDTKKLPPRYDACRIILDFADRADLYSRIDSRVDEMVRLGLFDEVRSLVAMGVSETGTAMQAIGYKEALCAVRGECSEQEAAEIIKRSSRRYAKRQLSWLRRDAEALRISWGSKPDFEEGLLRSTEFLEINGIIVPSQNI